MKNAFMMFNILLLVLFLKLIDITFALTSTLFTIQAIASIILVVLGISFLMKVKDKHPNARKAGAMYFTLVLIDALFIYVALGFSIKQASIPLAIAAIGILLSTKAKKRRRKTKKAEPIPETKVILQDYEVKEEETTEEPKKTVAKKTYSPGKFVASKFAKNYHAPKCDWAKKIKEKNQVWLKDKKEAKKKGYKPHSCLTK